MFFFIYQIYIRINKLKYIVPMYTDLNKRDIFDNTLVKLVFEFHSPIDRAKLARKLSTHLRKKIVYGRNFKPSTMQTDRIFTLTPGFNEGYTLNNLITGYMSYNEAMFIAYRTMDLINEYGFTTDKTRMHVSFKNKGNVRITNIGAYKFLLNTNESDILKEWNEYRGERLYYNNLIYIYPRDVFSLTLNENFISHMNSQNYMFPNSIFLGTNLSEMGQGVITVSYIGGKNYHMNKDKVSDLMNDFVISYNKAITEAKFDSSEVAKLRTIIGSQRDFIHSIKTYESFSFNYPEINLYVDLKGHKDVVKTKYHMIRDKLFELLAYGHVIRGDVNFDSSRNRVQAMNVTITNGVNIRNVDFLESKLVADVSNCHLHGCEVSSSNLSECNIFDTNIKYSRINECFMADTVEIDRSYVYNKKNQVNGVLRGSVVYGPLSSDAEIDSHTKVYF